MLRRGGQLPAAEEHSVGHDDSQHRIAAGPRRRAVPLGRHRARRWRLVRPTGRRSTCRAAKFAACRPAAGRRSARSAIRITMNVVFGKAGRNRWKGRRPHVRGTAMNPIDHPHGGGEGRTKGGRHPVSPTGKPAKGGSTRKRRKPSNAAIVRRRRSRRYGQLKIKLTVFEFTEPNRRLSRHGKVTQERPVRRRQAGARSRITRGQPWVWDSRSKAGPAAKDAKSSGGG